MKRECCFWIMISQSNGQCGNRISHKEIVGNGSASYTVFLWYCHLILALGWGGSQWDLSHKYWTMASSMDFPLCFLHTYFAR